MKRLISLLLLMFLLFSLLPASAAAIEDPLGRFAVRNGPRDEKRIAVTVDDFFDLPNKKIKEKPAWKIRDLLHELGVTATFFPCGFTILPEDGPEWQLAIDYGIEIGSHNWGHYKMGSKDTWSILSSLGRTQEALDAALGYHYQIHCFRPPNGNIENAKGNGTTFRNAVSRFGYQHVILWEVSQTDPKKALQKTKNGSILLFHSRTRDYNCLKVLIPQLLEKGFELVTVSELLGFGENSVRPEPYVYRKEDYQ